MKPVQTFIAILLIGSSAIQAQPDAHGPCLLEVHVPLEFEDYTSTADELVYKHKRNSSTFIISRTEPEESLFTAKSVAMNRYEEILADTQYSAQTMQQIIIEGEEFYVISYRKAIAAGEELLMSALTARCSVLYELNLKADPKKTEKMEELFYSTLETCAGQAPIEAASAF